MAEIHVWSRFAADNTLPSPDGWLEHIPAGANNDIAREIIAALARHRDAVHGYPTSTGTENNTYQVAIAQSIPHLFHGLRVSFTAHQDSVDGAGTFRVNTTSSRSIVGVSAGGLKAGEIKSGRIYDVVFSGLRYQILNPSVVEDGAEVRLDAIPNVLFGKNASTVSGLSFSTSETGTDASTLYFRDNRLLLGSTEITSLVP